jgi:uncharacterized Zn finger protein
LGRSRLAFIIKRSVYFSDRAKPLTHYLKGENKMADLYRCKTCGAVAPDKGHLCDPTGAGEDYVCDSCGSHAHQKKHLCKPKLSEIQYYCGSCGRAAVKEEEVCNPQAVK